MTSAISTTIVAVQAKYDNNILSLRKLIEKSLLLKNFLFTTLFLNPDATFKTSFFANTLSKVLTKRWNQADLGYFDSHFDKTYGEGKIVSVGKNIYYRNIVFFV